MNLNQASLFRVPCSLIFISFTYCLYFNRQIRCIHTKSELGFEHKIKVRYEPHVCFKRNNLSLILWCQKKTYLNREISPVVVSLVWREILLETFPPTSHWVKLTWILPLSCFQSEIAAWSYFLVDFKCDYPVKPCAILVSKEGLAKLVPDIIAMDSSISWCHILNSLSQTFFPTPHVLLSIG